MKQTAVDWLIDMVEDNIGLIPEHIIEKAKEMEKEQMNNAYKEGYFVTFPSDKDFNEYYKETYEENG